MDYSLASGFKLMKQVYSFENFFTIFNFRSFETGFVENSHKLDSNLITTGYLTFVSDFPCDLEESC